MEERINIGFEEDPSCEIPQVIIKADNKTELVDRIITAIEQCVSRENEKVVLYEGDKLHFTDPKDIIRVYTEKRKLMVCTSEGLFRSRLTLKEFESKLDDTVFTRISRFEVINLKKISRFDLSISGTIKVTFDDGTDTWVARRFVGEIGRKIRAEENKGGKI